MYSASLHVVLCLSRSTTNIDCRFISVKVAGPIQLLLLVILLLMRFAGAVSVAILLDVNDV